MFKLAKDAEYNVSKQREGQINNSILEELWHFYVTESDLRVDTSYQNSIAANQNAPAAAEAQTIKPFGKWHMEDVFSLYLIVRHQRK